jgi:hypothetical protein
MRQVLSVILTFAIVARLAPASPDTARVTAQIVAMPLGANIELRLKTKQKIRGSRGAVSNTGFALVDAHAAEQQIAFDDVVWVKEFSGKSHTTRNVVIIVGVAAVATIAIIIGVALRCGPFGCNSKL